MVIPHARNTTRLSAARRRRTSPTVNVKRHSCKGATSTLNALANFASVLRDGSFIPISKRAR